MLFLWIRTLQICKKTFFTLIDKWKGYGDKLMKLNSFRKVDKKINTSVSII